MEEDNIVTFSGWNKKGPNNCSPHDPSVLVPVSLMAWDLVRLCVHYVLSSSYVIHSMALQLSPTGHTFKWKLVEAEHTLMKGCQANIAALYLIIPYSQRNSDWSRFDLATPFTSYYVMCWATLNTIQATFTKICYINVSPFKSN